MFKEFKEFAMRGSVIDLAVGIIIGASFNGVVNSLVNDILMPPLGFVVKEANFSNLFFSLSGQDFATLTDARAAGAATVNYGMFINALINFVLVAVAVFFLVKQINRMRGGLKPSQAAKQEPTTKQCPYCISTIPIKATRCQQCTSQL